MLCSKQCVLCAGNPKCCKPPHHHPTTSLSANCVSLIRFQTQDFELFWAFGFVCKVPVGHRMDERARKLCRYHNSSIEIGSVPISLAIWSVPLVSEHSWDVAYVVESCFQPQVLQSTWLPWRLWEQSLALFVNLSQFLKSLGVAGGGAR